jgi:Flp pilus assembly protein protease CpaA
MIIFAIALGLITSYTDVREGKVKNIHLALAFVLTLAFLIYTQAELAAIAMNFSLSLALSYLFWHLGIWTSGDAKLFSVYALIVPLAVYKFGPVPYFPAAVILVNTFVPIFIFYFVKLILKKRLKKLMVAKEAFSFSRIVLSIMAVFAISWPLDAIQHPLFSNFFVKLLIIFIALSALESVKIETSLLFGVISLFRLILDSNVYRLGFAAEMLILTCTYIITRIFLLELSFLSYSREVDLHLLRPGMVPAEEISFSFEKKPAMFQSLLRSSSGVFHLRAEGLTEHDCRTLRRLKREGKLKFDHLRVYETLPFAIFLFIGVLLTYVMRGNLFIYLASLF